MSKRSRKRGKKPEGPLKCHRCNQDFQNSPKRTKHLVSTRRDGSTLMMEVNLCPPCQDHHSLIKFINILGRNAGSEELQQIAARLPKSRVHRPEPAQRPSIVFNTIKLGQPGTTET